MTEKLELTAPITSAVSVPSASVDVDKLDTAKPLVEIFAPYQTTLEKWEAKAASLIVTDISQKAEMKQARIARLELRDARCTMKETKLNLTRHLKERAGKIDSTEKFFRDRFDALEAKLLESEEFAERYAAKVKAELRARREAELVPFLDTFLVEDLSNFSESDFTQIVADAKARRRAKIDAAAKAEADHLAKEAEDKAERERIAAENAKLKEIAIEMERQAEVQRKQHEAEIAEQKRIAEVEFKRVQAVRAAEKAEADAELKRREERRKVEIEAERKLRQAAEDEARKEREAIQAAADDELKKAAALRLADFKAAEAKVKKAREETDRLNAELTARAKAESDRLAQIEADRIADAEEVRRVKAAPDKSKLKAFILSLTKVPLPAIENVKLLSEIVCKRDAFIDWIESHIDLL